jgi:Helix-turn-helix domain
MQVSLAAADLEPLVERIIEAVVSRLETVRAAMGDQLAFSEERAAQLLELETHVLRDERRRGRIIASKIVGRRIRYQRADLLQYLAERRVA